MNTTERIPDRAQAAATAFARLPVDAADSTAKPIALAAEAATATTRSLNECVGFPLSSFTHNERIPSSAASFSAGTRRVMPTWRSTSGAAGSSPPYRHMVRGPASIEARVTRRIAASS